MATSDFPFPIKLPGVSIYKMRGTNKMVARGKGGPSAEKVRTDPKFIGTRNQQSQFSVSSSTAKKIRDAMFSVSHLADYPLHGHLVKLNAAVMEMDPDNRLGKQSLIFSRGLHFFEGLSLNRGITFDSVVTTPIPYTLDRSECRATLHLPSLSAGINFNSPWTYPFFRFRMNLGIVRDMVFVDHKGYQPLTPAVNEHTAGFDTEWAPVKVGYPSQVVELQITNPVFDEHCHLVLSVGIEFGSQSRGTIQHVKYAGCAKILAMG